MSALFEYSRIYPLPGDELYGRHAYSVRDPWGFLGYVERVRGGWAASYHATTLTRLAEVGPIHRTRSDAADALYHQCERNALSRLTGESVR